MNRFSEFSTSPKHVGSALMLAALILSVAACAPQSVPSSTTQEPAPEESPEFMFVQISENVEVDTDANTLRLVNVGQQTVYFSDRPVRMAGSLKMADYLEEWTTLAGADNFDADPPNASLSVFEEGQPDNTLAVVEITDPVIDGSDLIYSFTLLEGTLPAEGGATTLFIDKIGVGGGVGVGYHGVGVGRRGPGVR
jgi:hypothetical protein